MSPTSSHISSTYTTTRLDSLNTHDPLRHGDYSKAMDFNFAVTKFLGVVSEFCLFRKCWRSLKVFHFNSFLQKKRKMQYLHPKAILFSLETARYEILTSVVVVRTCLFANSLCHRILMNRLQSRNVRLEILVILIFNN